MKSLFSAALLAACCLLGTTFGQSASPEVDPARLRSQLDASVGWNEFKVSGNATPVKPLSVYRWTNNERDPHGQGLAVIWEQGGVPVAVASIFPWNGKIMHEMESVSRRPFAVHREGMAVWTPAEGMTFRTVPDAAEPADQPVLRLRQMKELADRFVVTMLGWKPDSSDREELRRLPKELFRYKPSSSGPIDGAIFSFVKGTDPETLLVLEAVAGKEKEEWQYLLVPQTSGGLSARIGQEVVWNVAAHRPRRDPQATFVSLAGPLKE